MLALYGFKFIATIGIFLHHLSFPHSTGSLFTTFFFVFSGFITVYNFEKKNFVLNRKSLKQFYLDKFIKNYPIYLITLIISIPYVKDTQLLTFDLFDFLRHAFMLQVIAPYGKKIYMFNGLSWFLADLMIFYLVIPFIYHFIKKFKIDCKIYKLFICFGLFSIVEIVFSLIFNQGIEAYTTTWWLLYISPMSRLLNFLLGFLFGFIYLHLQKKWETVCQKIPYLLYTFLEIISLLSIPATMILEKHIPSSFSVNGSTYLIFSFICIFIFAHGKGFISKLFSTKVMVYLGKISLMIYMFHQVVINYMALYLGVRPWYNVDLGRKQNLIVAFLMFLITLCFSDAMWRYVFQPLTLKLQRKVLSR